jgi:hypothetical protein
VGFVIDENTRKMIKNGTESQRAAAIVDVLNSTYKGFNASLRDTPVGQLQLLTNAADDAKEVIGEGLVDALAKIGGGSEAADAVKTINNIANGINKITSVTATAIGGLVKLYKAIEFVTTLGGLTGADGILAQRFGTNTTTPSTNRSASPAGTALRLRQQREQEALAAKREKERMALTKKQLDATKKLTAEQKKQASLKKSGTVFDLDQIQIVAALKGRVTKEEELRLQAQLALLNGNADLAKKLTDQILMAQDSTGNLSRFLAALPNARNPFEYLDAYLSYLAGKAAAISMGTPFGQAAPSGNATVAPTPSVPATNVPTLPSDNMITYNTRTGLNYNPNANNQVIELRLVSDGNKLIDAIAEGLQQKSLSNGDSAYINRRTGGFAG